MDSVEIIKQASLLADLQNSQYITHEDKLAAINASYRDLYESLTKSDDDFFVETATLNPATIQVIDEFSFTIDVPANCYRLRSASYDWGGTWRELQKFPMNLRHMRMNVPMYRWRGQALWITGISTVSGTYPSLAISYYPPPDTVVLPTSEIQYLATTAPSSIALNSLQYTPFNETLIYASGSTIYAEASSTKATYTLYAGAHPITQVRYLSGYIYFLMQGEVWRGVTNLAGTMVPAAITATAGTIINFSVSNNILYYTNGTTTKYAALDGTGVTPLYASAAYDIVNQAGILSYRTATGVLYVAAVSTGLTIQTLTGDSTGLFYLGTDGVIYKYVATGSLVLYEYAAIMGQIYSGMIGLTTLYDTKVYAINAVIPTTFDYPLNLTYEIMEYQCAIDFKRKNGADFTALSTRLEQLWGRYSSQKNRDDYKPERIQNAYSSMYGPWRG